jgi:putative pyruvate formate lyase activating enzyme
MGSVGAMQNQTTPGCLLCPRCCGAERDVGARGVCGADNSLRIARAALHFWEEPPISGNRGSGAVFFCNCPLHCVYCQNQAISHGVTGAAISVERLAEIFCELQAQGAHNINLVTPTQYLPQIRSALNSARSVGLHVPIVYNTSGYERPDVIAMLAGYVDIFLTDFRYATSELAARYSQAPDYPTVALTALRAMRRVANTYEQSDAGILRRGIIVRFLLLPGYVKEAQQAVATVFSAFGNDVCYSLMNQFTPLPECGRRYPELNRTVSDEEYDALIDFALDLGVTNSFMQEEATASEHYIPPFDLTGVR